MARIPPRKSNSLSGSQFIQSIANIKSGSERDKRIYNEIIGGNIPDFLRSFIPIKIEQNGNTLVYNVMPDYLAVGDDQDYVRVPLGAYTAQRLADDFQCTLPTPKISDQVWSAASVKLPPKPMGASSRMTQTDAFVEHNQIIQQQYNQSKPGQLVAGHKKDIVISNQLLGKKNRLGIHGLHTSDGKPIQGGALSPHSTDYSDYSHGIRLVDRDCTLNGQRVDLIDDVAKNKKYAYLISNEGTLAFTSYNGESPKRSVEPKEDKPVEEGTKPQMIAQTAPKNNSQGRLKLLQRIFDYVSAVERS